MSSLPGLPPPTVTTSAAAPTAVPSASAGSPAATHPAAGSTGPTTTSSATTPALPAWVAAALAQSPATPPAAPSTEGSATPSPTATADAHGTDQRQAALQQQPTAAPTPPPPPPLYEAYTVLPGDTVSGIAARLGVRTQDVINNNVGVISSGSLLLVGATLQIPTVPGVLHNVRVGETLADIADAYGVSLEDILGFAGNRIEDPNAVLEGTQILVVNGTPPAAPAPAAPESEVVATPEPTPEATPLPTPTAPPKPVYQFIWPLRGNITSFFGPSHPKGIDISVAYQPVAASAAGKVVFVGGDPCCSYGYYIDIQHADGYMTRYAHLSKFLVTLGQQVDQGDTIAISGNTGYSTGAHLHFEIQKNGAVRNPLDFLP